MPIARLITFSPELTHTVTSSLEAAGYTVEIASPEDHFDTTAELEVNLDDPSAGYSYLVTGDGKEIAFAYDQSIEREFVLAPAWHSFRKRIQPWFQRTKQPATIIQVSAPAANYASMADTTVLPVEDAGAEAHAGPALQSEVLSESLYLQRQPALVEPGVEPVSFSSAEYFDGIGTRKHGPDLSHPTQEVPNHEPATASPVPAVMLPASAAIMRWALRAEAIKSRMAAQWAFRRAAMQAVDQRAGKPSLRSYDLAWMRAVPVAAVLVLAFLLGWEVSSINNVRTGTTKSVSAVKIAAITPAASTIAFPVRVETKPVLVMKTAPAKPVRQRNLQDEEFDDELTGDVVVRHYPRNYLSKEVRAANQRSVKRFSDVD